MSAFNDYSNKTSAPLDLQVIERLSAVGIALRSDTVLNTPIKFAAQHFAGTKVTYYWDWNDGSAEFMTSSKDVQHSYAVSAKYKVRLRAVNALGTSNASHVIFVLSKPCKTPQVRFLGDATRHVTPATDIKVEAIVRIKCQVTESATFHWSVVHRNSAATHPFVLPANSLSNDPTLFIPRHVLPYGNYTVGLMVSWLLLDTMQNCIAKLLTVTLVCSLLNVRLTGSPERNHSGV